MSDPFQFHDASGVFEPPLKRNYGPWRFDPELLTLTHARQNYEIDLERVTDCGECLDWIAQIAGKEWQDEVSAVGWLVLALDDIFCLQATFCGSGDMLRLDNVKSFLERAITKRGVERGTQP